MGVMRKEVKDFLLLISNKDQVVEKSWPMEMALSWAGTRGTMVRKSLITRNPGRSPWGWAPHRPCHRVVRFLDPDPESCNHPTSLPPKASATE
jgi:hypothetical protein